MNPAFWLGRRVFLTGHTGFKGSWLSLWLQSLGADVTGFALAPTSEASLFESARVRSGMRSIIGDVRDLSALMQAMRNAKPEVVIHMAAQALVRESYISPLLTYAVNVMGTANVLETVRTVSSVRAVVSVTTDKCYENREWHWSYREDEHLGGHDPYSSSKACAELVTAAYRRSFFAGSKGHPDVAVATARAGNVIGGGDWAKDRLIPDVLAALSQQRAVHIRYPDSIRPWQFVLEPLSGYLTLAERLASCAGDEFAQAWNFGPNVEDVKPVSWIVEHLLNRWPSKDGWIQSIGKQPHEATYLKLDCSKARVLLGWAPKYSLVTGIDTIVDWQRAYLNGEDMRAKTLNQIADYTDYPNP